jgi:hypothetical protein
VSTSADLAAVRHRIEHRDTARTDAVLDTLAGGLLRLFTRVNDHGMALARLSRRLDALERAQPQAPQKAAPALSGAAGNGLARSTEPPPRRRDTRRPARGAQPAIGGMMHREDLEKAWRD